MVDGKHSSQVFSLRKHLQVISTLFEAQNHLILLLVYISKYKEWKGMNQS